MKASICRWTQWSSLAGAWLLILLGPWGSPAAAQERLDHLSLVEQLGENAVAEMLAGLDLEPGMTIHIAPEAPHDANWFITHILARELQARGCQVILVPGVTTAPPPTPPEQTAPVAQAAEPEPEPEAGADADLEEDEFTEDEDATGDDDMSADDEEGDEDDEDEEELAAGPARRQARLAAQAAAQQATAAAGQAGTGAPSLVALELPSQGDLLTFRIVKFGITYASMKRVWFVGPQEIERIAEVRLQGTFVREPGHVLLGAASGDQVVFDRFPSQSRKVLEGHAYPFEIVQPPEKSLKRFIEPAFVVAIISGLVYLFAENQK